MLLSNISILRKRIFMNKFKILPYLTNKLYKSTSNKWSSDLVRSTFIEYYKNKHDHMYYKSSPVIPINDPSLLFINAGMNQFKSIFLGTCDPNTSLYSLTRVVNSQKCIRAGGKHNDLDDVGKDCYHHTFFEMLGTWSFGNYFKKEAISMTYDILVNVYKLDPSRLYASYFGGDESLNLKCDTESRDYWLNYLPENRILPFDKKDNFWEMGDIGPCGPCTEIHYDRIGNRDASHLVNMDDPDVIEIWNLVFIQYNREINGSLNLLPSKHVDTGMGLERLTSILQNKTSNYDTDLFLPIFFEIEKIIGCLPYTGKIGKEDADQKYKDMAYRVIADHIRTLTIAISDGAIPSNEGRGYVLRRILRRAIRYGIQTLGANPGFFSKLTPIVAQQLGGFFPEITLKQEEVALIIAEEEKSFSSLLQKGVKYFDEIALLIKLNGENTISGDRAFYLYDSLGFPLDLTQIMAEEQGLTVNVQEFNKYMNNQKKRSRDVNISKRLDGRIALELGTLDISYLNKNNITITNDNSKYKNDIITTTIDALFTSEGFVNFINTSNEEIFGLLLKSTCFYAESGGQVNDIGKILVTSPSTGTKMYLKVVDVKIYGGYILHTCSLCDDNSNDIIQLTTGINVELQVDYNRRQKIAPNHTMTHVLNFALRSIIGPGLDQKGSLVNEEKLRFDFNCNKSLTINEINDLELYVNKIINKDLVIDTKEVSLNEGLSINGIRAIFGEVYPDPVRVVSIGDKVDNLLIKSRSNSSCDYFSVEFCGGTHLKTTKDAIAFVIIEESAVSKGIRRLVCITGIEAKNIIIFGDLLLKELENLNIKINNIDINFNIEEIESLEKEMNEIRLKLNQNNLSYLVKNVIRNKLDSFQKDLYINKTKQLTQMIDIGVENAKQEIIYLNSTGVTTGIFNIELNLMDVRSTKRVFDEIKKVAGNVSFICIITDFSSKISVFSFVTKEMQSKIKANEWVNSVLSVLGGNGGGKSNIAQGSALFNDRLMKIALKDANKYRDDRINK